MKKLLVTLIAGTLALGCVTALSQVPTEKPIPCDSTLIAVSKMTVDEYKAARAACKAKWDKVTPEEKAAVEKAVPKKQKDLTIMDLIATQQMKLLMGDFWSPHDPMYRRRPPAEQKPTPKEQQ
jgi:hypothetical protein